MLLKNFGNLCRSQRFVEDLAEDECDLILALRNRVEKAEPIVTSPKLLQTWCVFTDGACETGVTGGKLGGVGGVLVSANGTYLQHFGMQVPEEASLYRQRFLSLCFDERGRRDLCRQTPCRLNHGP